MTAWLLVLLLGGCPTPEVEEPLHDVEDPLSRPLEPTLDPAAFHTSESCVECHPNHVREWSTSMHAYAITDPVFQALVGIRQADFGGRQDPFCMQCHTAIGVRGGEITPNFSFDELSPVVAEGVTCEACHKISSIARSWNAGHVLSPDGPLRGPLVDPAMNPFHESGPSPLFSGAELCGSCHDVVELDGLNLERPFSEWQESPAAEDGEPCQACHMPSREGQAAEGGPVRTLHSHRFVGVDVPLVDGVVTAEEEAEGRAEAEALLRTAASLALGVEAAGEQLDVAVTIRNEISGHNLPTGSTFLRQVWLELTATDADGAVLFVTGDLDANGDLRNYWSELDPHGDHDLVMLSSSLINAQGEPELFPWRATEHRSATLGPLLDRTVTLFVPVGPDTPGPVTIDARLRFRTHAPFLLRALGLPDLVERVGTYDLAEAQAIVGLPEP